MRGKCLRGVFGNVICVGREDLCWSVPPKLVELITLILTLEKTTEDNFQLWDRETARPFLRRNCKSQDLSIGKSLIIGKPDFPVQ